MVKTFDEFEELFELEKLPETTEELFEFIGTNLTSDLYKSKEFSDDELLILEEAEFYGIDKEIDKYLIRKDMNINESDIFEFLSPLLEVVGENSKRKLVRLTIKKRIHKLRMKYRKLVDDTRALFGKKSKKIKNRDARAANDNKLKKRLDTLKKWFDKMLAKLTGKKTVT